MFDFVNKPIRRMFNIAFCHHVLKIFETQPLRLSYITEFVKAPERWHPTNYERPLFALQKAFQMAKDGIKMQKRRTTDANNRKRTDTQNLLYPVWENALKSVSLSKTDISLTVLLQVLRVVICFKIRIFALRQTSLSNNCNHIYKLWFALKFVSLRLDKHLLLVRSETRQVVICFKIRIFALRQTSNGGITNLSNKLWFALKFVSLRLDKHHVESNKELLNSCDLL